MKNVVAIAIVVAALIIGVAIWAYGGRECSTRTYTQEGTVFTPGTSTTETTTCEWPWEN